MFIYFTNEHGFKTYFALKDFECLTENYLWIKSENAPRHLIDESQYYELACQIESLMDNKEIK